jgi:putative RNA 2'-phosphotransferase
MDLKKISIKMSYLLRHNPENLKIDKEGWVECDQLCSKLDIDRDLLNKIVKEDNKQRYSFDDSQVKIRANQGHSIKVDVKLEKKTPPVVLYHGTIKKNLGPIRKNGLLKMSRNHVHLSSDIETAWTVGKRRSKYESPMILKIDCKAMVKDGIDFYISKNNVWLVDHVKPEYISFVMQNEINEELNLDKK